jgi:hypothetical protein
MVKAQERAESLNSDRTDRPYHVSDIRLADDPVITKGCSHRRQEETGETTRGKACDIYIYICISNI